MITVQELIDLVNKNPELHTNYDVQEFIGDKANLVESGLGVTCIDDISVSMEVYECSDGYVGVNSIFHIFDYSVDMEDIDFEVTAVQVYPCLTKSFTSEKDSESCKLWNLYNNKSLNKN